VTRLHAWSLCCVESSTGDLHGLHVKARDPRPGGAHPSEAPAMLLSDSTYCAIPKPSPDKNGSQVAATMEAFRDTLYCSKKRHCWANVTGFCAAL